MSRCRLLAGAFVLAGFLLPACGGGGAGPGVRPDPPVNAQQLTEDIVSGCLQSSLDQLLTLRAAIEAGATAGAVPGIRMTGVDLSNPTQPAVTWAGDLDGDTIDDASGSVRLGGLSALQVAALAAQLGAPDADVAAVLSTLPTGTTLRNVFTATTPGLTAEGDVLVRLVNATGSQALPDTTTGSVTTTDAACEVTWSWTQLAVAGLVAGPYPIASMDVVVDSAMGQLTGVLVMDGTSTAALHTELQPSGAPSDFTLDLDTGVLTPL